MPAKNYTSSMPIGRIIAKIEKCLVDNGATNILKEYRKDGTLDSLSFHTYLDNGMLVPFKLPANVEEAFNYLLTLRKQKPTPAQRETMWQQAQRTAWKLVCDWVEVQMTMILLGQAKFAQVFLPYVYNPVKQLTLYEIAEKGDFKMLEAPGVGN